MTDRILIVDDSEDKKEAMERVILSHHTVKIEWVKTIRAANLIFDAYDWKVVLLDMLFEEAEGILRQSRKKPMAGRNVLQFISASGSDVPVIVVTAHDSFQKYRSSKSMNVTQLEAMLTRSFPRNFYGLVSARVGSSEWLNELDYFVGEFLK